MTYLKYFVQIEVSIQNEKEQRKRNNGTWEKTGCTQNKN